MSKQSPLELCNRHLFDDVNKLQHLHEDTVKKLVRIREGYTLWNEYPNKRPKEIVDFLLSKNDINKSQAYEDVRLIQELLGNINKASKDWHRFKFNSMVMKAYEVAEKKQDADAMQKAANTYAKFNQLDKEDANALPWEEIVPQTFVPSNDPSLLGIKPIPNINKKIADLKKKYENDIEDVTFENIDVEQLEKYDD
jgi:hypothetical protein